MNHVELVGLELSYMNTLDKTTKLVFIGNNKKITIEAEDNIASKFAFNNVPLAYLIIINGGSFPFDVSLRLKNDEYALYEELFIFDNDRNIYLRIVAKSFTLDEIPL